jgi:TolB-like protein
LDFVFKTSSGVNRPLRVSEDHPNDNMNKTFYRDQINKVANAIKEIILSLKSETVLSIKGKTYHDEPEMDIKTESEIKEPDKPVTISQNKMIFRFAALSMVILIILFFVFREVFNSKKTRVIRDHDGRISVAVNNFENNTNDTTLNWLKMGIPELLRNNLAVSKELLVQNTQTMNELYESLEQTKAASVIPSISREAAIRLRAGIYITGSYQRYGNDRY